MTSLITSLIIGVYAQYEHEAETVTKYHEDTGKPYEKEINNVVLKFLNTDIEIDNAWVENNQAWRYEMGSHYSNADGWVIGYSLGYVSGDDPFVEISLSEIEKRKSETIKYLNEHFDLPHPLNITLHLLYTYG
jgi:hypothetical protein